MQSRIIAARNDGTRVNVTPQPDGHIDDWNIDKADDPKHGGKACAFFLVFHEIS